MTEERGKGGRAAQATTVCFCVEAGLLEGQAVLLARSLRRFGGRYADAPAFALRPRFGPEVSRATRRTFDDLAIEYVATDLVGERSWLPHLNKAASLAWLETRAKTDYITWFDSDIAIVREPHGLIPDVPFRFAARPAEADMGTDGADANADYWRRVSEAAGLDYRRCQMVESWPEGKRMHGYWHGGVFTFDAKSGYGARHLDIFNRIVDARISSRSCGVYHTDQVAQTLAALAVTDVVHVYHWRLNCDFPLANERENLERLKECAALHYHGRFFSEHVEQSRAALATNYLPVEAGELIRASIPIKLAMAPGARLLRKALIETRTRRQRRHARECVVS